MTEQVLFVDDEPQVLEGIQRALRKKLVIQIATSGEEGLRLIAERGPFAVVVSDMQMPNMSGATFLAQVRQVTPDTVRMVLSGQADLAATIDAVNEGRIYRFLCKPCSADSLLQAVEDGLQQFRLLSAEKVLLEQTLSGCVKMLIELLGMINPAASGRASRLQRYTVCLANSLELEPQWQWNIAAYVSQIGCVALPAGLMSKVQAGETLSEDETKLHESHPDVASKLLATIPRLEDVAEIVTAQFGPLNLSALPTDMHSWDVCSTGRALLRITLEYDRLLMSGVPPKRAIDQLRSQKLGIPEPMINALRHLVPAPHGRIARVIRLKDLAVGMTLDQDIESPRGIRLVPAGYEVTSSLIVRLKSAAHGVGVAEPFRVLVPS